MVMIVAKCTTFPIINLLHWMAANLPSGSAQRATELSTLKVHNSVVTSSEDLPGHFAS